MPRSSRTFKLNWGTGLPGLQPRWDGEYSVFVGDLGREVGEADLVVSVLALSRLALSNSDRQLLNIGVVHTTVSVDQVCQGHVRSLYWLVARVRFRPICRRERYGTSVIAGPKRRQWAVTSWSHLEDQRSERTQQRQGSSIPSKVWSKWRLLAAIHGSIGGRHRKLSRILELCTSLAFHTFRPAVTWHSRWDRRVYFFACFQRIFKYIRRNVSHRSSQPRLPQQRAFERFVALV